MGKIARYVYAATAWLFVLGVALQVFMAGMVVVAGQMGWDDGHVFLGRLMAGPLLVMVVAMYLGRMSGHVKRLTWLLFAVYMLQTGVMFLRVQAPLAAALHPVLALVEFALGVALVRSVWPLAGTVESQTSARADLESAAAA